MAKKKSAAKTSTKSSTGWTNPDPIEHPVDPGPRATERFEEPVSSDPEETERIMIARARARGESADD
jgi:hypothetical protein